MRPVELFFSMSNLRVKCNREIAWGVDNSAQTKNRPRLAESGLCLER